MAHPDPLEGDVSEPAAGLLVRALLIGQAAVALPAAIASCQEPWEEQVSLPNALSC